RLGTGARETCAPALLLHSPAVRRFSAPTFKLNSCVIFGERGASMAYPGNFRYTREHEWISVDGNIGTVGITDYAQNSLGDIVYVDMPKVGDSISANAT